MKRGVVVETLESVRALRGPPTRQKRSAAFELSGPWTEGRIVTLCEHCSQARSACRPRMAARGSIRSRSRARDGVVTLESGVVVTLKKTALHAEHVRLGAKLVDFAGWDMPIQYASQLDEHHAVRQARSEARRVGKDGLLTCSTRGSPDH